MQRSGSRLTSLRAKLLLLLGILIVPGIVVLSIYVIGNYRNERRLETAGQRQLTQSFAMQYITVLRSARRVGATLLALPNSALSNGECHALLERMLAGNPGYRFIAIRDDDGQSCIAGDKAMAERALEGSPGRVEHLPGTSSPPLDAQAIDEGQNPAVVLHVTDRSGGGNDEPGKPRSDVRTVLVAISASWFDQLSTWLDSQGAGTFAMTTDRGSVMAQSGHESASTGWMPSVKLPTGSITDPAAVIEKSRDGRSFAYSSAQLIDGQLSIIGGFPMPFFGAPERQLLVAIAVPLTLLSIIGALVWLGLDRLVLGWAANLRGVTALYAAGDYSARSKINSNLPRELNELDEAFNFMAASIEHRTSELARASAEKSEILRELHHRVKNNFQVMTSFLSLAKREASGAALEQLALAECRVHAMAAAYRLALAEGDIRLVKASELLDDVGLFVGRILSKRLPMPIVEATSEARIDLDQALPLAMLLSEILWSFPARGATSQILVLIAKPSLDLVSVRISCQPPLVEPLTIPRFARAFIGQLQPVSVLQNEAGPVLVEILFPHRRPGPIT